MSARKNLTIAIIDQIMKQKQQGERKISLAIVLSVRLNRSRK